jgi:sugar lactone lactonase YvrE
MAWKGLTMRRRALLLTFSVLIVAGCSLTLQGDKLDDRSTPPLFSARQDLQIVAALGHPPGKIAVSADRRIFISLHPAGNPETKVAEIKSGQLNPYPDFASQQERFDTPLALRIDRQRRLWVLDYARHGIGDIKLVTIDLKHDRVVDEYRFPSEIAGLGSMLNDLHVDAAGETIYISDTSIWRQKPALIVYNVKQRRARRLLEGHATVRNGPYVVHIQDQPHKLLGFFSLKFGVDGIALSRDGRWLYYAPLNGGHLYRIATDWLKNEKLAAERLTATIERCAEISFTDGITTDNRGRVYLSDMENGAIHRVDINGELQTLLMDSQRLRWPEGFSFGPNGWLYFTDSAFQHVILKSKGTIRANAPYYIYRFQPDARAYPGH